MNAPSGHVLSNAGFFDFSHCRLRPLQYRLPARFDTIPSRPSLQALANTSAPSADRASLNRIADSDEAARLKRDDCAQGFLDDAAPL